MSWNTGDFESFMFHLNQELSVRNIASKDTITTQRFILSFAYIILNVFYWSSLVNNDQQHAVDYTTSCNTRGFEALFHP